jgi:hypothetical protein
VDFELVSELTDVETIATGRSMRELPRLRRLYGKGRWRKMKGVARIRLRDGRIRLAELHWYEAHGLGKKGVQAQELPRLDRARPAQLIGTSRSASTTTATRPHSSATRSTSSFPTRMPRATRTFASSTKAAWITCSQRTVSSPSRFPQPSRRRF